MGRKPDLGLAVSTLLRELMTCAGLSTVRDVERESRKPRSRAGRAPGCLSKSTVSELTRREKPRWPTREQFEIFVDTCLGYARAHARSLPIHLRNANLLDRRYVELTAQRSRRLAVTPPQRPSTSTVPRQLPGATSRFVGRAEELAKLSRLLDERSNSSPAAVISTISGSPGVGKTALAIHWAHTIQDQFPDGTLYVDLRGYDRVSPMATERVLDEFLRTLDVPAECIPTGLDALVARYRSAVDGRRVLVVLDNAASAGQVRPLLPASPGCMAIVTSRSQLSALTVREGAHSIVVDLLSAAEAIELLRRIVGEGRIAAEHDSAAKVFRLCAGLPLALRIAAARITTRPHSTLTELAAELAVQHNRLNVLDTDDETASVRTVFSWSYRGLTDETARLFRLLALHPGPKVSTQATAALVGLSLEQARKQLHSLTKAHLVEEIGKDRYRFHDLLCCYAQELLTDKGTESEDAAQDQSQAERRVLAWYLHSADAADRFITPNRAYRAPLDSVPPGCLPQVFADHHEAIRWSEAELTNLLAATRRASDTGQYDTAWKLPAALWGLCYLGAHSTDWITLLDLALPAVRQTGERSGEAWTLHSLGLAHRDQRQLSQAINYFQNALALWRSIGHRSGEAAVLRKLGDAYARQEQWDEAIDLVRQSLAITQAIGEHWGSGYALSTLGEIYRNAGQFDNALCCLREALIIVRDTHHDWRGEGHVLSNLGDVYQCQQRHDDAIDHYLQALVASREAGHRYVEVQTLYHLGISYFEAGKFDAAYQSLHEAMTIFEKLGDPRAEEVRNRLRSLEPLTRKFD
jgi:tetratricopeptide (TPR) repeat protein